MSVPFSVLLVWSLKLFPWNNDKSESLPHPPVKVKPVRIIGKNTFSCCTTNRKKTQLSNSQPGPQGLISVYLLVAKMLPYWSSLYTQPVQLTDMHIYSQMYKRDNVQRTRTKIKAVTAMSKHNQPYSPYKLVECLSQLLTYFYRTHHWKTS